MSSFGNLSPDKLLQTPPDITIVLRGRVEREHAGPEPRDRGGVGRPMDRLGDETLSSAARSGSGAGAGSGSESGSVLLGVLASAGVKWGGRVLQVGSWQLAMSTDREVLACVADPATWAGVQQLEMRVYPMGAEIPPDFLPTTSAPAWVGAAGRKTRWEPVGDAMPEKMLTDGKRGLVLRVVDGLPVMDWFHVVPRAVFWEVEGIAGRGDGMCLQAAMVERSRSVMAAEGGRWFGALPTVFRPLSR